MIVKALMLPVVIVVLVFGSVFVLRVFRDKRLLFTLIPVVVAAIALAGITALFKLLLLVLVATLVIGALVLIRQNNAPGP